MPINVRYHKPVCNGCTKGVVLRVFPYTTCCTVYERVPGAYLRANLCPFNPPVAKASNKRVRVGQQKQRKVR